MITAPFLQWSLSVAFTATFVYAVLGALSRKALTEKIAYVFHALMSVAMFTMVWRSPPAHATERCFHSGHDVVSDAYRRPRQGEERWGSLRETSRRSPQSALPRGDDGGDGPNGDRDAQHGRHVLDDNSHLHELPWAPCREWTCRAGRARRRRYRSGYPSVQPSASSGSASARSSSSGALSRR